MTYSVCVVEDELQARKTMEDYFRRWGQEHGKDFSITFFEHPLMLLENYRPQWDVIYMDIQMPLMNGMEAAEAG